MNEPAGNRRPFRPVFGNTFLPCCYGPKTLLCCLGVGGQVCRQTLGPSFIPRRPQRGRDTSPWRRSIRRKTCNIMRVKRRCHSNLNFCFKLKCSRLTFLVAYRPSPKNQFGYLKAISIEMQEQHFHQNGGLNNVIQINPHFQLIVLNMNGQIRRVRPLLFLIREECCCSSNAANESDMFQLRWSACCSNVTAFICIRVFLKLSWTIEL